MPKAFGAHEKELINARLLEHGYELFSQYGLKKTSIEELAVASGISKAALLYFLSIQRSALPGSSGTG